MGRTAKTGIPVLMYHALESPNQPCGLSEPGELLYVLSVAVFRQQMKLYPMKGSALFL